MTLKDIAKEAGVSISTVSRVINQKGSAPASKEVQNKIWDIVRKNGYSPNAAAKSLKSGKNPHKIPFSRSIACIFTHGQTPTEDNFFSALARGIDHEAFKHNYTVKYMIFSPHSGKFSLTDTHTDGAVILGHCDTQICSHLKKYFHNVVYSGLNHSNTSYDRIICDGYAAAVSAVEELMNLGHSKIAYIGETAGENRYEGYCAALTSKNFPINRNYVVNTSTGYEGGYQGALKLLQKAADFTAVFCPDDMTAIGTMKALQERNLRIPKDVSLISIGDIDIVQYVTPMLTTVHIPIAEMGQMAAKILIDRIEGGHHLPMEVSLPFYIASRESCAVPHRKYSTDI